MTMRHDYGSDWPAYIVEAVTLVGMLALIYAVLVFLPGK